MTLESSYRLEMSVIFHKITTCKFIWTESIETSYHTFIFVAGSLIFVTVLLLLRRHELKPSKSSHYKKQYKIRIKHAEILGSANVKKYNAFKLHKLILGNMLGSGAFGIVYKGTLILRNGKKMCVAVKTLRKEASIKEIQQLQKEITLMENVGFHKNIVSIIGSCSDRNKPLLIVEYCPLGDLQSYLRKEWKQLSENLTRANRNGKIHYENFADVNVENHNFAENKLYGLPSKAIEGLNLTICDLLSFGRQVAIGMEYLASNYVVHRDLAARNVLLSDKKTVKISDFGLSRDIYTENIYRITDGNELMPIKWMALESIERQEFTTQTDIWSFGVFLWELFTLGEEPYKNITSSELLYFYLKNGDRLNSPQLAENDLYEIMLNCWHEVPKRRPTFTILRNKLDDLLKSSTPHQYVSLSQLYQRII